MINVIIPDSVIHIGKAAFASFMPDTVYYCGTREEWGKISINSNNEKLISANIYYNYGKEIDDSPTSENLVITRKVLLNGDNDLLIDYNGDNKTNVLDLVRLKNI